MLKEEFLHIMGPCVEYYGATFPPEQSKIFYDALGGWSVDKLQRAIEMHMQRAKSFPKIPHLKELVESKKDKISSAGERTTQHRLHAIIAQDLLNCMIEKRLAPTHEVSTLFPIEPLVQQAYEIYSNETREHHNQAYRKTRRAGVAIGWLEIAITKKIDVHLGKFT